MKAADPAAPEPFASLEEALACLERGRAWQYSGEAVTHWDHALQTAAMAQRARAAPALVVAALLHDIGHLAVPLATPGTPSLHGIDDRHEVLAPRLLSRLFDVEVTEPIRLHVAAKRCLVSLSADYAAALSEDSRRSLQLQGGPMTAEEAAAFRRLPHADAALRLRCWDDLAKDPAAPSLGLEAFRDALRAVLEGRSDLRGGRRRPTAAPSTRFS